MDRCKDCGNELHVTGSRYEVRNDNTPDKATELYVVLTLECVNPQCPSCGKQFDDSIEQEISTAKNSSIEA